MLDDFQIFLVLLSVVSVIWYFGLARPQEKKAEEKAKRLAVEEEKQLILNRLQLRTYERFDVELEKIHESATQDEIVRIVNLLAHQTAVACVNQDKEGRGGRVSDSCRFSSWAADAGYLKRRWSEAKNLALEIAPKLADRMPHFSEFEPLKSYNAEHLQKKAEKRAVS